MDGEVTDVERDLAKDLELCEAATKGPWRVIGEHFMERPLREHMHLGGIGTDSIYVCAWGIEGPCGDSKGIVPDDADLAFIAESREGWPEAIRRAMAAEAEVEKAVKMLQAAIDWSPEYAMPSEELKKAIEDCPECKRAQQRSWPPSGLCNDHYCQFDKEVWSVNKRHDDCRHVDLRRFMRDVLEMLKGGDPS